jgi:hypothetical protein
LHLLILHLKLGTCQGRWYSDWTGMRQQGD